MVAGTDYLFEFIFLQPRTVVLCRVNINDNALPAVALANAGE